MNPDGALEIKPSLRAAVDVPLKIMATLAGASLPIVIPALFLGEPAAATAVFFGFEAIGLYPAVIAAFLPAIQLAFTRYRFDDDGITIHTQVLAKTERRVPWEKVTAVQHRRTWIDAALGIERLDVIAYGERGATLRLQGLFAAAELRDQVARRMRESASVEALFRGD